MLKTVTFICPATNIEVTTSNFLFSVNDLNLHPYSGYSYSQEVDVVCTCGESHTFKV